PDAGEPASGDSYRARWRWDKVVKGTHLLNCWYGRSCAYNVYVKDGVVVWEEPAGEYPQTNPSLPDFNPRGCQKGACYSLHMYHPARVMRPLKRVGERGEGNWKEVSWDEALTEIADKIIDTLVRDGPAAIVFDGNAAGVASFVAVHRFANQLGAIVLDLNTEVGDEQQGAAVTFGTPVASKSADDYLHSDLIFIWGGNPAYTQIPNCHFYNEARYHGARVVAISPDFNASAVHADWWIPVRPGTDAALALAMAQVVISQELFDADFVREQTDLPFLVRTDTRRFLRESDMRRNGKDDAFYVFDLHKSRPVKAPKKTLKLGGILPALEGEYEVDTRDGKVKVRPAFQLLKERLDQEYTPEQASTVCDVHPETIRALASAIARAKAASCIAGASLSKYYHGDLMMRAQILLFALCGQMGKKGAGYDTLPIFMIEGTLSLPFAQGLGRLNALKSMAPVLPTFLRLKMKGYNNELTMFELARNLVSVGGVNAVLFWYFHAGLREVSGKSKEWDPYLQKDVDEYLEESARLGWQPLPPEQQPRVFFASGSNPLRRVRGAHKLIQEFLPRLDLVVSIEFRMSSTALHADYVLPAAASYEKCDVTDWYTPLSPFAHVTNPAVPPVGETKPEWEIMALLARKIQERAKEHGLLTYADASGKGRRLDNLYERMTFGGAFTEKDHGKVAEAVIKASSHLEKASWQEFRDKGFLRFTRLGSHPGNFGNATDMKPGETITPHTWRTEKKIPWPTLTRRIQFHIDHPLYMELGEEFPVHKDPPKSGGGYPLVMTGGHNRHSIHASFRTNPLLLQLERGEPVIFMSLLDARERAIEDHDLVKVYNDVGEFLVRAKLSPAVRPGQVIVYHAWENYQFPGGIGHRNVIASPINPVELAGDYFHLRPAPAILQPGQNDRETRVEVARA
ncbi:MAG: hypothetical protein A2148_09685, partial [Chloroflexi bacterium RBG_16_68_14]